MDLKRKGANINYGYKRLFDNMKPDLSFENKSGSVIFFVHNVKDSTMYGHYDYHFTLSPEDIVSLLGFISQSAAFENTPLRESLEQSSKDLLRLLIASSAIPFDSATIATNT